MAVASALAPIVLAGCGGGSGESTGAVGAIPIGSVCTPSTESHPILAAPHVAVGTPIDWNSNPPSSGAHYAFWSAWQTFPTPVPRAYYVHSLEHGAVAFLYRCTSSNGCPDVVAALEHVVKSMPDDKACLADGGVRIRAVVSPDPLLDVPIAAVAWGWTYKASCLDEASLLAFANAHYAKAPEQECAPGLTTF